MADNILQHILEAEQQADAMLSEAKAEASEAIKGAQTAVREEERKAAVEHRALFRQIVESKRQEVQARLDAQTDVRRDEIEAFIRNASSRLSQASDMIVQEVLADGDR